LTELLATEHVRQSAKYVVVGVVGYVLTIVVFAGLSALGVGYALAAVLAAWCALAHNFLWNRHWTFNATSGPIGRQAVRYFATSIVFLCVNVAVLHLLVVAGVAEVVAEAIAVLVIVPPNFLVQRHWSFQT
jgi:putative flippase GtrA